MGEPWETPAPGTWKGVPGRLALRSVQGCERGEGTLLCWIKGSEGQGRLMAVPMRCGSWRCRRCSWKVGRFDFERIERAVKSKPRWLYCVFTFNPRELSNPWEAYRLAYNLWDKRLKRRLERRYGRLKYLQTWEAHRSGWPHVNVLMAGDGLLEHIDRLKNEWRWAPDAAHGKGRLAHWTPFRRELRGHVAASGMQRADWVEIMDNPDGFAWYFAKLAHELTSASLKASDQTPIMAPRHFRRFRGSKGLIPSPRKVRWLRTVDKDTGEISWDCRFKQGEGADWTGVVSPRSFDEFENRDPSWSTHWTEAMDYQERAKKKRARMALEIKAGIRLSVPTLES